MQNEMQWYIFISVQQLRKTATLKLKLRRETGLMNTCLAVRSHDGAAGVIAPPPSQSSGHFGPAADLVQHEGVGKVGVADVRGPCEMYAVKLGTLRQCRSLKFLSVTKICVRNLSEICQESVRFKIVSELYWNFFWKLSIFYFSTGWPIWPWASFC